MTCVYALLIVGLLLGIVGLVGYFVLWPLQELADMSDDLE